jgi:hypothetical protein
MPGIAPYIRTLAAGARTKIEARGTTIFVRRTTEELLVRARTTQVASGTGVEYQARMAASEKWFTAEEFDSVSLENTGSAATEVEILLGFGDFFRPVPDIVNVAIDVPASRAIVTVVDKVNIDVGQAGKEQLAAINLTRLRAVVTADAGNAEIIRVGDTHVDTDRGVPLAAGESLSIESTAAIFACSIATIDQVAAITEFVV